METIEAILLKGIGGFYYINWNGQEIECKAGGRLRLRREREFMDLDSDSAVLVRQRKLRKPAE